VEGVFTSKTSWDASTVAEEIRNGSDAMPVIHESKKTVPISGMRFIPSR